jgi:hypothetical protein
MIFESQESSTFVTFMPKRVVDAAPRVREGTGFGAVRKRTRIPL